MGYKSKVLNSVLKTSISLRSNNKFVSESESD